MQKQNRREFLKNTLAAGTGLAVSYGFWAGCCANKCEKDKSSSAKNTDEDYDKLAYCCLNCPACDLFIATRDNNQQLKAEVAREWKMDKNENFKLEDFNCYGCKADKPAYFHAHCTVKKCAVEKQLPTCAHCDDLDSCDKDLWKDFPWIKDKAKGVRAKLNS